MRGPICVRVRADRALFTDPAFTVERYSYDVPTKNAMRYVLRSVFAHGGMDYRIKNIFVCRKIRRDTITRNETKAVQSFTNPQPFLLVNESSKRMVRGSSFLTNVEYVVEAEIVRVPCNYGKKHTLDDFYAMFNRRLDRGGNQHTPYLGVREFSCYVRRCTDTFVDTVYARQKLDLGVMYQDVKRDKDGNDIPLYAHVFLDDGRLVYDRWFAAMDGETGV